MIRLHFVATIKGMIRKSSDDMSNLQSRIQEIESRIQQACDRANRKRSDIEVVAVTKSVSAKRTEEMLAAGFTHLGENRPDGFLNKLKQIDEEAQWHFIGNLQSRRVKDLIEDVSHIHSLSRISIAKEIHKRASKPVDCFVQVNVSGEASKSGLEPSELIPFIEQLAPYTNVRVIGLMTMAPNTDNDAEIRQYFSDLRQLRDEVRDLQLAHAPCTELSMGMSNDFEIAIEEGSTYIRIGTALVGEESEGV